MALTSGVDSPLEGLLRPATIVRRVMPDGSYTTVAGTGESGFAGDGGPATDAQLNYPRDVSIGPDGSLYIADKSNDVIRRVAPDGIITTVAGVGGQFGYEGDGGVATEAELGDPEAVAVAPDGTLYIGDSQNFVVRRVAPDGIIMTVAGTGDWRHSGDGGPAVVAEIGWVVDILIGGDGSIFLLQSDNVDASIPGAIRRIGPDGIMETIAGRWGGSWEFQENMPAMDLRLTPGAGMAQGQDGSFYVSDSYHYRVLRITPEGFVQTAAGSGEWGYSGDRGPAALAKLGAGGLAMAPDGTMYLSDSSNEAIRRVTSAFPGMSGADILIPSEDGSRLYVFDGLGRHLETLNALTGATLLDFDYDDEGRLLSITDGDGNVTAIEREEEGEASAIVAPFGQRTPLTLDANGYLTAVTNPADETIVLEYSSDGLLTSVAGPKGHTYEFTYDDDGLLVRADDPAGGFSELSRSETASGHEVSLTTAEGRESTYTLETLPEGGRRLVKVLPDNTQVEALIGKDESRTVTHPDGTEASATRGPDPRFGMQAAINQSLTLNVPCGNETLVPQASIDRTVAFLDPDDPLSITTLTDTIAVNGRSYTLEYDAPSRTFTGTTPQGRQNLTRIDELGRVVERQGPALPKTTFAYDDSGRLTSVTFTSWEDPSQTRYFSSTYDSNGYLETLADNLGRTKRYTYDGAGRVLTETLPDGNVIEFNYDLNGNLAGVLPPGRPPHTFVYNQVDRMAQYTPPNVGTLLPGTTYLYNADRQATRVTRPDGQALDFAYDSKGKLNAIGLPGDREVGYTYDGTTGKLTGITSPDGVTVTLDYYGILLASIAWSGPISGTVTRSYDENFRITQFEVSGAPSAIDMSYDDDNLLTQAGAMSLTRDPQHGLVTATALDNIMDTRIYNGFGEPVSYSAAFDDTVLYSAEYTRDPVGRIIQKTETVAGETTTHRYAYDLFGSLIEVRDGSDTTLSIYAYDSNGNRLTGPGVTVDATYDDQDRLLEYGDKAYTYTDNGELLTKTTDGATTTYEYDVLGNLKRVTLPDGRDVVYIVDGQGRRIGKKLNGSQVKGFFYTDNLHPIAELDGTNNIVSLFVYAARSNVPDFILKEDGGGGLLPYRIISDDLGSPRLVVNAETGEIVQRMDYDEFGRVLTDTNPGFQPFAFAGGLYDPDTGLTRFGFRDYDAGTGRWTAKDPTLFASVHRNLYVYSFNDPVNFTDPIGLKADANRDESPTSVGEIIHVAGLPRIQRDGEGPWMPLMEGMHVNIGDVIETGPETYLDFEFLSGSRVGINENTTLQVTGTSEVTDITKRSAVENLMRSAADLWNKITQPEGDFFTEGIPMTIKG